MQALKGPRTKQVQSSTEIFKLAVNSYYREAVYYFHQPRSAHIKFLGLLSLAYVLF